MINTELSQYSSRSQNIYSVYTLQLPTAKDRKKSIYRYIQAITNTE